jgi:sterol desaturase/sphingolipid hydroxylase (fatty acid hydroxylase superfamily)
MPILVGMYYDTPVDDFLEKVWSLLVTVLFGFEPEVVWVSMGFEPTTFRLVRRQIQRLLIP